MRTAALKHGFDRDLACYTFGAPRVGNHAFARDFDLVSFYLVHKVASGAAREDCNRRFGTSPLSFHW